MNIVYFTHSLESCWNHGNAHFVRGVLSELIARGHKVVALEPHDSWSRANLVSDGGEAALAPYRTAYPELASRRYRTLADIEPVLDNADLAIVHEWNDPALIGRLGEVRARGGRFLLLFHDTHHRAISAPETMRAFPLDQYDGILAFGETLAEVYRGWGWGKNCRVWHEAADTRRFRPPPPEQAPERAGLVWIGNWGDDERSAELDTFLFTPAAALGLPLDIYGVRYPDAARAMLNARGARYHGWAPNIAVPQIFARHLATVHVPRRHYATQLPGIPTIRMFEALACGIPLVSAPWADSEGLFRPDRDYLRAGTGEAMRRHLAALAADPALAAEIAASGLETVRSRHSCAHRAEELLGIVAEMKAAPDREIAA